jgi:WD40 repeat protein
MENYAAIMKGGESGEVVDPGEGELSTLTIMIEDGSMPKDADPLTAEEIATIKKWIDTGAILDAGISGSAELITYIPKLPQPAPPESYRVTLPVTALAFSPDGKQLASSGYHEVLIWNSETGELLKRISNVAERVYDLEYSPDGTRIAVAAGTPAQIGEAKIFDVASGNLLADLVRTGDSVFAVAYSPDGTRLAIGCADRSIRVFDANTFQQQLIVEDHADWVNDVAWSPDGTKLVSASRDKTAKVFDAKTGDSMVTFNSHNNTVNGVAFTPDGKQVVSSGADRQLRIWNVSDAKQVRNIGGFADEVFRLAVSPEGDVFSVSADKNARRHKIADGKAIKAYSGHADWVYSLARDAATHRIATGSYDGTIRIWDENEAKVLKEWTAAPGLQVAKE